MKRVRATARVRITLDIALTDTWGPDCPMTQVHDQARDGVLGMLRNNERHELTRAMIVGEPHVTAIFTEEER